MIKKKVIKYISIKYILLQLMNIYCGNYIYKAILGAVIIYKAMLGATIDKEKSNTIT